MSTGCFLGVNMINFSLELIIIWLMLIYWLFNDDDDE